MINNIYLRKAMASSKMHISQPAKAIAGTLGYADRLLGVSARKMRTKANNLGEVMNKMPTSELSYNREGLKGIHADYTSEANNLTRASRNTKIKTGLAVGGAVLAHKAMSNYSQSQQPQYDYSQYQQY